MPTFEASCPECGHYDTYVTTVAERNNVPMCKICQAQMEKVIFTAPGVRPDLDDFSTENGGKGRFNKQLMTHVTSKQDAIDKATARGWDVVDKA